MTDWSVETAETGAALAQARALRHAVFVEEMGASPEADADRFDETARHLVLRDHSRPGRAVIGTLRVTEGAAYTAQEFDLSALQSDPRPLAEIGRMCLDPDYRGGLAGIALLTEAVGLLRAGGTGLLVGTGSFPGATPETHMPALRALRDAALAPPELRPVAHGAGALAITGQGNPSDMVHVPSLLKAYLRAGALVGEGAWVDRAFNTIDICLVLDLAQVRLPRGLPERGLSL